MNDKIAYDRQVGKFGAARASFAKVLFSKGEFKESRIPKWEDDRVWREHYNSKDSNRKIVGSWGSETVKVLSGPEELRDTCYEIMMKEAAEGYKNCNSHAGWCDTCLFQQGWYNTPTNY